MGNKVRSQSPGAASSVAAPPATPAAVVEIYVTEHCPICAFADEIAALIRHEFPAVALHVITLGTPGVTIPESVFATPTYLLNGRRWSLGNPSPAEVRATLDEYQRRGKT